MHCLFPRLALLVLLLCASCISSSYAQQISISGTGGFTMAKVVSGWSFAYSLLRPNLDISWAGSTSQQAINGVMAGNIDFGGIVTVLSQPERDAGLFQYPLTAVQVAVLYRFDNNNTMHTPNTLNLTRNAVCRLFAGNLTKWDDPEILDHNPALAANPAYVDQNVTVIVRGDSNGGTRVFTNLVNAFNCPIWADTYVNRTFSIFPSHFLSLPHVRQFTTAIGVAGGVLTIPFSVSYDELSYALDDNIPYARLQANTGPSNASIIFAQASVTTASSAAINNIILDSNTNSADIANLPNRPEYPDIGVYPLLTLGYLILDRNFNASTCEQEREILKLIQWGMTDPTAAQIGVLSGFISLPGNIRDQVLDQLHDLQCEGRHLLRTVALAQHTSPAFKVLLALSMVIWALCLVGIGTAWYMGSRSKNPLFYAICLGVGTSLAFCSLIFFYLVPDEDWVCQLRQWFLASGLTLLFGVMFARGWQLHTLHVRRDEAPSSGKKDIVSTTALLAIMGGLFAVQLLLLIIWTAVDKLSSRRRFPNTIDLESRFICGSDRILVWLLLELAYFICLLGWGMYVVYRTWKSRAAVDSRWTLIAIYNTLMTIIVIIPLLATVAKSDDWVFFLAVLGTDFAIMSAVGSIYGSVLLKRLWDQVSGGSGSSSKEKVSTFRTSMSGEGTIA